MMEFKNAVLYAPGRIDCEVNHPKFGWIVTTLDPLDPETADQHDGVLQSGDYISSPEPSDAWKLLQKRTAAFMPKGDFCLSLYGLGKLSSADADVAAGGGWPGPFVGAVAGLPEDQQLGARIKWRTAGNVYRMDPLLLAVASHMTANPDLPDMTDADLDALFGI